MRVTTRFMTIETFHDDADDTGFFSRRNVVRLVKFGLVGFSGVGVNLVIFEFFFRVVLLPVPEEQRLVVANVAGVIVSIFTNFVLNDRWTWGDRAKGGRTDWFARLGKYYVLASVAAGVQVFATWLSFRLVWDNLALVVHDVDLSPTASLLTGIAFGMVINFLASHFWAFRDVEETPS
jgi:putative flippase GtrA